MISLIGQKMQGWRLSPLLVLFVLSFYHLGDTPVHFAQLQFFQLGMVLLVAFGLKGHGQVSSWACPFRWLVLAAMSQLLWVPLDNGGFLYTVRQVIIVYIFFEACVFYDIQFKT